MPAPLRLDVGWSFLGGLGVASFCCSYVRGFAMLFAVHAEELVASKGIWLLIFSPP